MKVLMINSVSGIRSTGRICTDLAEEFIAAGHEVKIAYGREIVPQKYKDLSVRIGNKIDVYIGVIKSRILDNEGFNNVRATKKFLKWADEYNPDLLWLHNLHGYYINVDLLFDWIKKHPNMQVKWTLHDCWAFTGHCSYFTMAKCEKWKKQCDNCIQTRTYPASIGADNSKKNYTRKKRAFNGVKNMTLITPSKWLGDLLKQSFLGNYAIEIKNNTIDLNVFKPTLSNFRERYGLENKKIILGVASTWEKRKGLEDFIKLSRMLDSNYNIVMVGLTKQQINGMPKNIVCIEKTNDAYELAAIYTATDVFLNLTYEDNYPTVNLEAQACGTPCITYRTGGSIESVPEENVIEQGNLIQVKERILELL